MSAFVPSLARRPAKAGPVGIGAGPLMTQYLLPESLGGATPASKARRALETGRSVPVIRAAEGIISRHVSTVEWTLRDPEDRVIDAAYPSETARSAFALLDRPQAAVEKGRRFTRRELLDLTSRHMGLAGTAFWYLDRPSPTGRPLAILYIRPDRMTPSEDKAGNLLGWRLDATTTNPGIPLDLDEVIPFYLQAPDSGHMGTGLVETAMMKAGLATGADRHMADVISAGGRISGIIGPKQGVIEDEGVFQQLVNDWRSITEQPQAAKRAQIVRAPVEFTRTTSDPAELQILELMSIVRDDLLSLWGVPRSVIGLESGRGLNSGEGRKYDEAALWQNAIHPRLIAIAETIETHLLARWAPELGWTPTFTFTEPEFDDEAPKYALLAQSLGVALSNAERRAIIGKEPTGVAEFDQQVLLPMNVVPAGFVPDEQGRMPVAPTPAPVVAVPDENTRAATAANETPEGKAGLADSMTRLRATIANRTEPHLRTSVTKVLREQRDAIVALVRARGAQIARKPTDLSVWWDGERWDRRMTEALRPAVASIATSVSDHVASALPPAKADLADGAIDYVLSQAAVRVGGINLYTRDALASLIAGGIDAGLSMDELATSIEAWSGWDEYRSERIARTETGFAYNEAALASYRAAGVQTVHVIDGDGDDLCAPWADWTGPIDAAPEPLGHPNCTRDILPVVTELLP